MIEKEEFPTTVEMLSQEDHVNEYLLTSLRTKWGIDLAKFNLERTLDKSYIERLIMDKYAILEERKLILTKRGKLLADKIASDLFI